MNSEWLKARQTKYSAYLFTYLVVIIAVLGVTNWLAKNHNKSYDSTANKRYSLSDQTAKVVKGLKQDIKLIYFDQNNRSQFKQAADLLDRYAVLSNKVHIEYIDVDRQRREAIAAGFRARETALGTTLAVNGNRREEAKSLTEEEITGALIRSLKTGERNVCFVSGSGEHGIDDTGRAGYSSVKESLEKNNYKTRTISLLQAGNATTPQAVKLGQPAAPPADAAKPAVPSDCTALVVAGPRYEYTQPEVDAIKAYVEDGGRALFLIDPPLKLGRDVYTDSPELSKVLESWGVTLNKDLALDTSGIGQIFGLGPEVPLVTSYESQPIVRDMKEIATAFPLARTMDVKSPAKGTAEKLFATSASSFATTRINSAEIRIDPKTDKKGPLTLAAAGTYKGDKSKEGRFVVVGSSNWASNNILRFNGNRDLFLNMMNWLSSDEDLISIRPKEPEDRRLNITSGQMSVLFYMSMVFLPLMVVASGFAVWWRRR
jgi:gliding motility-associatede transport system auxiliary component